MFVRLVVGHDGQHHKELAGLFENLERLSADGDLSAEEAARFEELCDWFARHLRVPPFGSAAWPEDCVCWFKSGAQDVVARMWDLAAILSDHDRPVRLLRAARPGRIVYEDEHQVVVEEWRRL